MYELYILGELLGSPKHGYLLHSILQIALGPVRKISWGSLYPLIRRLEEGGLIRQGKDASADGGRSRKVYEITEAGQARFYEIMAEPLEHHTETDVYFQLKLIYFPYVSKEIQLACLRQYLAYVKSIETHILHVEVDLRASEEMEREHLQSLRVLSYRKQLLSADRGWVENEIKRIEGND